MKKPIVPLLTLALLACNTGVKENANPASDSQIKVKDSVINNLLQSFNEIQDNLNEIKLKENILTVNVQSPELQKSQKDQIKTDIALIYDLLNKNRKLLTSMNEKLKDSTVKINQLQKFIGNLLSQVTNGELEVNSMKKQIASLKIELDTLQVHNLNTQLASDQKTGLLNRGYFAIGTMEELKKEGVLIEKGGVIGVGKVTELNPDLTQDMFSVIDKSEKKDIAIAAKHVKVIGPHPGDSYSIDDQKKTVKTISIKDPKKFWSTSNYIIIVVSNDKPIPQEFAGISTQNRY